MNDSSLIDCPTDAGVEVIAPTQCQADCSPSESCPVSCYWVDGAPVLVSGSLCDARPGGAIKAACLGVSAGISVSLERFMADIKKMEEELLMGEADEPFLVPSTD